MCFCGPKARLTRLFQLNDLGERVERLERLISDKMDAMQMNMASMLRDVLISDIMQDRQALSYSGDSLLTLN